MKSSVPARRNRIFTIENKKQPEPKTPSKNTNKKPEVKLNTDIKF